MSPPPPLYPRDYSYSARIAALADGTEIRIGDFTSFVAGTAGGDVIIGTEGNDFVYAGDGDDEIRLLAGNDVGIGAGDRMGAANDNCADAVAA
ncbi:MAG: hypothetical protein QOC65_556 [Sphingomonadales bacterium]|nr:hypothetical protein [Sphingomonadales bacterium]